MTTSDLRPFVYFRCDAGAAYGLGHLMRCISLGQGFKRVSLDSAFLMREIEGSASHRHLIETLGFVCYPLPDTAVGLCFDPEAFDISPAPRITVFDCYDVDAQQMAAYHTRYGRLVAVDDMADRTFSADVIINQNIGAESLAYKAVNDVELLLGTRYVLLRESILFSGSRPRKGSGDPLRVLVTFGGGAVFRRIHPFLDILCRMDRELEADVRLDFVIGADSPDNQALKDCLTGLRKIQINWITGEYDLSDRMRSADFAITAGGTSVFELAYLGIPQIVLIIDKNQELTGRRVDTAGIGKCLGYAWEISEREFVRTFQAFSTNHSMALTMAENGREFVDGKGADRVVENILSRFAYPLPRKT